MNGSPFLRTLLLALLVTIIVAAAPSFAQHGGGFHGGGFHSGGGSFNGYHGRGTNSFHHGGHGYYGPHYHGGYHDHPYYGLYYGYPGYGYGLSFGFGFGPFWGFWVYPSAYGYYPAPLPYYAPYGYYRRYGSYNGQDGPSNAPEDQANVGRTAPGPQRNSQNRCDFRYEDTCKNKEHRPGTPLGGTRPETFPRVYVTSGRVQ